jgi:redox-sensitive bicupin YhaK (pirin superfamily)
MITLRRARDRHHDRRSAHQVWLTFSSRDQADPLADGFGALETLSEDRLSPGASIPLHPHVDAESITYVREGVLAYEDSMGGTGIVHAGEFHRLTAGRGIRHSETNASQANWAHFFQIWLRPSQAGLDPGHEQKRFSAAERRGVLCLVASTDGRSGSLRIHQDALVYSAMLLPGQHLIHELPRGRSAWLHVVQGEILLGDVVLTAGDGAGVTVERAVSLTAREESELLLLDLGDAQPGPRLHLARP